MRTDEADPKGLVRESYRIEAITAPECRSIFLDWALSLAPGANEGVALECLLEHYGPDAPAHPMTEVLRAGLAAAGPWTFLAQNLPRDGKTAFDWRICPPVASAGAYDGPLEVLHLEPIMVASAVHLGPIRTLFTQGYAPLLRAIGEMP